MRRFCLILFCLLLPVQAMALSCSRYAVADALRDARAAEESYIIVRGRLDFDARELPETDWNNQGATPPRTRIKARVRGNSLTREGFTRAFRSPIAFDLLCFGPWCPGAVPGREGLMFLKQTKAGYVLEITACNGFLFDAPDAATQSYLQRCAFSANDTCR